MPGDTPTHPDAPLNRLNRQPRSSTKSVPVDDNTLLAVLDWSDYTCQWWRCNNTAVNEVHTHVIDSCNNDDVCDPFGNTIHLLCDTHTSRLKLAAARRLEKNAKRRRACCSCGAPVITITDIIRSVTRLAAAVGRKETSA